MPQAARGLYAPRFVDTTFAIMGIGSAVLLANGQTLEITQQPPSRTDLVAGLIILTTVVLICLSACLVHRTDRRGWDDYMAQVVSQSAVIGMVTLLISGAAIDFLLRPLLSVPAPNSMIQGMIPIAALSWTIGYAFLRIRGPGG